MGKNRVGCSMLLALANKSWRDNLKSLFSMSFYAEINSSTINYFLLPLSQFGLENNQQFHYLENTSIDLSGTDGRSGDVDVPVLRLKTGLTMILEDLTSISKMIGCRKYRLIWLLKQYNFQYSERQR